MLDEKVLKLLVCPEKRTSLSLTDADLVRKLNDAIERRALKNKAGRTLDRTLDGALIREGGDVAYPIVDDIPMLLIDEGIPLGQIVS